MHKKIKIICCSDKKRFADNSSHIFLSLYEKPNLNVKYVVNNLELRTILKKKYGPHFISTKSFKGFYHLLTSDYWLLDSGMPTKNIFIMFNKKIINFWHGFPIKKIGINGYSGFHYYRMYLQLKIFSYFIDYYCVQSSCLINIFSESFLIPKYKVKVYGQPRNDQIHSLNHNEIYKNFGLDIKNSRNILYAPTWRKSKYGTSQKSETKYFPFDDFNEQKLTEFLEFNNINIFLREHKLENSKKLKSKRIYYFDQDTFPDINKHLNFFDLLISDYSGIITDYLILNKPIILIPYDLEPYKKIKGLNFNFDEFNPGPNNINSFKVFKLEIIKLLNNNSYQNQKRKKLNYKFNEVNSNCIPKILSKLNL